MEYKTVVHIAATPQDRKQFCMRCGCILINGDGIKTYAVNGGSDLPRFWPTGGFVGTYSKDTEFGTMSFSLQHDALENDEVKCLIGS